MDPQSSTGSNGIQREDQRSKLTAPSTEKALEAISNISPQKDPVPSSGVDTTVQEQRSSEEVVADQTSSRNGQYSMGKLHL